MRVSNTLLRFLRGAVEPRPSSLTHPNFILSRQCLHQRPHLHTHLHHGHPRNSLQQKRFQHNPADDPNFVGLADGPPKMVSTKRKHGPGIFLLAAIPITAFLLGSWQVQRLGWKTDLIARFEDRLVQPPLPLPPTVDPNAIHDFDYRRVYTTGRYRHDQEMLIGPRVHDGENGYLVITPLERKDGSKVLVNRGWIAKDKADPRRRMPYGLPLGEVSVQGLLREPWKKNLFTPANKPEKGEWYFPDVYAMAETAGSTPVWIEATMQPDLMLAWDREAKGVPIGRPAEVNLRNTHTQYIFTWYSLCFATSIMFWMVVKKPARSNMARVRRNIDWS